MGGERRWRYEEDGRRGGGLYLCGPKCGRGGGGSYLNLVGVGVGRSRSPSTGSSDSASSRFHPTDSPDFCPEEETESSLDIQHVPQAVPHGGTQRPRRLRASRGSYGSRGSPIGNPNGLPPTGHNGQNGHNGGKDSLLSPLTHRSPALKFSVSAILGGEEDKEAQRRRHDPPEQSFNNPRK